MKFKPDYSWEKYGSKTKLLAKNQLVNYLNSMLPLWVDGTSSTSGAVLRRKGILQSLGYDVGFVFVDTPVETAIKRNQERNRTVDVDFLERSYKRSQQLKSYYRSEFKFFREILNGEGELIDSVINAAYKQTTSFFSSPIENPIGKQTKDELIESGGKYLIDSDHDMADLNKLVESWYRK
jgi:hypothetical protein